jgi:hypothetical protein
MKLEMTSIWIIIHLVLTLLSSLLLYELHIRLVIDKMCMLRNNSTSISMMVMWMVLSIKHVKSFHVSMLVWKHWVLKEFMMFLKPTS